MFYSYDTGKYAKLMKDIRVGCKLTQSDVQKLCGVNCDTLRKIENGTSIPKIETLELISEVYKTDLITLYRSCRENSILKDFYMSLDEGIASSDPHKLNEIYAEFSALNVDCYFEDILNKNHLVLIEIFIKEASNFFNGEFINHQFSIKCLIGALQLVEDDYRLDDFSTYMYDNVEIRILLLIGLIHAKLSEFERSNSILQFCLNYLKNSPVQSTETRKLVTKLILNVSYNHHLLSNYKLAYEYAESGISYILETFSIYCLPQLYARKAVAELKLSSGNHQDSFNKCIHLLEIIGDFELAEVYRSITYKEYGISI